MSRSQQPTPRSWPRKAVLEPKTLGASGDPATHSLGHAGRVEEKDAKSGLVFRLWAKRAGWASITHTRDCGAHRPRAVHAIKRLTVVAACDWLRASRNALWLAETVTEQPGRSIRTTGVRNVSLVPPSTGCWLSSQSLFMPTRVFRNVVKDPSTEPTGQFWFCWHGRIVAWSWRITWLVYSQKYTMDPYDRWTVYINLK